jgi:glycerol kinase
VENGENHFKHTNGLIISTYFSLFKLLWLLENVTAVKDAYDKDDLCFVTIDTWVLYKLTLGKQHLTDVSNASRTFMMNIHTK